MTTNLTLFAFGSTLYPHYGNYRKNTKNDYTSLSYLPSGGAQCTYYEVIALKTQKNEKEIKKTTTPAPEINISPVPDIVPGRRHFVQVTRNSCRSSVYDILLKFENLPVIVTGRKRILSVTYEIMPGGDR